MVMIRYTRSVQFFASSWKYGVVNCLACCNVISIKRFFWGLTWLLNIPVKYTLKKNHLRSDIRWIENENIVLVSLCSKQKRIVLVGKEESRLQWKKDYKIAIQRRLRQICQIHFTWWRSASTDSAVWSARNFTISQQQTFLAANSRRCAYSFHLFRINSTTCKRENFIFTHIKA